jgi:pSer/pThr/pTyr-binding forkhead associated (FHA) protein
MNSTVIPISPAIPHVGLTIGRAEDCDLVVSDRTVSRHHASLIHYDEGGWVIRDLGSKNGTRVNGVRVDVEAPIEPGDELGFGAAVMRFAPGGRRLLAADRAA